MAEGEMEREIKGGLDRGRIAMRMMMVVVGDGERKWRCGGFAGLDVYLYVPHYMHGRCA